MKDSDRVDSARRVKNRNLCREDEYSRDAKLTKKVVEKNIKKGSFSEIAEQLNELQNVCNKGEKLIFEHNYSKMYMLVIAMFLIFSVGYLCFVPIFIGAFIYSDLYELTSLAGIILTSIILVLNIVVVVNIISKMHFNKRYNVYAKDLRFKNIEIIDDLAFYTNIKPERVVKDLRMAIKLKLIPQGHFGKDDLIFITSDEVFEKYKNKQEVYDKYYRQQLTERLRMKERTKEMQDILDRGQEYINTIHASNDIIKDRAISQKLDRMENIVSVIFHEVDLNPRHADKLDMFLNYYLPTTEKLLEAYIEIDDKQLKGENLEKTQKDIGDAIDAIINHFEGILDKFYKDKVLDITTDINTMEIIMKQDNVGE